LDPAGLVDSINASVLAIVFGRKGFATRGKAEEGRISYETGITLAMTTFQKAQATADPETIILAEYTFLTQELEFCEKTDNDSLSSLNQAIQSFDDAFLALEVVKDKTLYQGVDKAIPHSGKHRIKGFPMDAYHIACKGHRTRLQNILKTPGLDPIEKALLKQRYVNLSAGQEGYVELQRKILESK
jgi:hypothetical protein